MTVPRVIHQTWKDDRVPAQYQAWHRSVRDLHPHHEHRLWTDADNRRLIAEHFPGVLAAYDGFAHDIERADTARYAILAVHGGVYVDLDMELLRPVDQLLEPHDLVFSLEAGPVIAQTEISNAFMACEAGEPFFVELLEHIATTDAPDVTWSEMLARTGPALVHRQLLAGPHGRRATVVGLDHICPVGVLSQHPHLPHPRTVEAVRRRRDLVALHHNTESWVPHLRPPDPPPPGYRLLPDHDLPGHDRRFVEVHDDLDVLVAACDADADAVGFNSNGFVKGPGEIVPVDREGGRWLCLKVEGLRAG